MGIFNRLSINRSKVLRGLADAMLINVAVLTSIVIRLVKFVMTGDDANKADYKIFLWDNIIGYRSSAIRLTLVCLIVFSLSGFYSYGRTYRGRYKALVVTHAVSLAYLLYGLLSYFISGTGLQPGTYLYAWFVSIVLLVGSRLWTSLWSNIVRAEAPSFKQTDECKARKVLLVGGAGYIGSALLPMLLEKGYHVRLLDLFLYGAEPIRDFLHHPRLEIMRADFRQVDKVVEGTKDMDAVIHLGAIVGDPACALNEDLTIEVNLMATRMIAEVAKGSGVSRFIFASTCSVYGACDEVLDEHSVLNPVSLYARSKIASERVLLSLSDSNFAPTVLRFGTIYGLSGRTRFDLVINLLTAKALVEGQITIRGGDQWRPFVHVHDAALAVFKTLEAPFSLVKNQTFNVGSNEQNYTIYQIGKIINQFVPAAQIIDQGPDTDRRNYRVNFNKIRDILGFAPAWVVEKGVAQVIEAIESGKIMDYRDPRYSNVKFLGNERVSSLALQNGWAEELIRESAAQYASVA
ncbi:MAG TPA: NAD-dependent epimerase/dehydratase family protein [Blastocatellia bacterium]|nr:NAD-dependent epimerase/dehydratase family protein [Blastocatellia bacterium]